MATWIDTLLENVGDVVLDNKNVKFSTHHVRKNFIKKLKTLVKESIEKNVPTSEIIGKRHDAVTITRPKDPLSSKIQSGSVGLDRDGNPIRLTNQSVVER